MIKRLPYPEEGKPDPRIELDSALGVLEWNIPGVRKTKESRKIEPDAPSWWHGDEEASQLFMQSMGVRLE